MSISTLLHNIGDIIEGIEKKIGFSDDETKAIRAQGSAVLASFTTKWASDSKLSLLALALPYVDAVKNDPSTFLSQAESLIAAASAKELQITVEDAKDALRTALISAS